MMSLFALFAFWIFLSIALDSSPLSLLHSFLKLKTFILSNTSPFRSSICFSRFSLCTNGSRLPLSPRSLFSICAWKTSYLSSDRYPDKDYLSDSTWLLWASLSILFSSVLKVVWTGRSNISSLFLVIKLF